MVSYFQSYNLLPDLTALENVEFSTELAGLSREEAKTTLHMVGLSGRLDHYPAELSGGEQQRVSIAKHPKVDDKTSFNSIMESMSVLIWFMIASSVVLGFTVLYSVGLVNFSAREYEYMFMGVMDYPHKSILLAHVKETIFQLAFAIPVGFLLGRLLLKASRASFQAVALLSPSQSARKAI